MTVLTKLIIAICLLVVTVSENAHWTSSDDISHVYTRIVITDSTTVRAY